MSNNFIHYLTTVDDTLFFTLVLTNGSEFHFEVASHSNELFHNNEANAEATTAERFTQWVSALQECIAQHQLKEKRLDNLKKLQSFMGSNDIEDHGDGDDNDNDINVHHHHHHHQQQQKDETVQGIPAEEGQTRSFGELFIAKARATTRRVSF